MLSRKPLSAVTISLMLVLFLAIIQVYGEPRPQRLPNPNKHLSKFYMDGKELKGPPKIDEAGMYRGMTLDGHLLSGETFTFENYMLCEQGTTIRHEFWWDLDTSRTVTPGDICVGVGNMTDGDSTQFNPMLPADQDGIANGEIYNRFEDVTVFHDVLLQQGYGGPFIKKVIQADGSMVFQGDTSVVALDGPENIDKLVERVIRNAEKPLITIKGKLLIEGVTPPNGLYKMIFVGKCPVWQVPDEYGNFEIVFFNELSEDYFDMLFFLDVGAGVLLPEPVNIDIPKSGIVDVGTIRLTRPQAVVMGKITDQHGDPIGPICMELAQTGGSTKYQSSATSIYMGDFTFRVPPGEYVLKVTELHGGYGPYFYMYPEEEYRISLAEGDTAIQDIVCYKPNPGAFVYVSYDRPKEIKSRVFPVFVSSNGYRMKSYINSLTGLAKVPVARELGESFEVTPSRDSRGLGEFEYLLPEFEVSIGDTAGVKIAKSAPPVPQSETE